MTHPGFRLPVFRLIAGAALAVGLISSPALAQNDVTSPNDPCGSSSGNPCAGDSNTGGPAAPFDFDPIDAPATEDRGVFVSQIGTTNRASVIQRGSTNSYAQVAQDGADNAVDLTQGADGTHHSNIAQDGDGNAVLANQDGDGQTALLLGQEGDLNSATVSQTDGGLLYSAAAVLQSGTGNSLVLIQNGDDNQARLTQDGDNNAMTATQLDAGNRLEWTQQGNGLSDLQITQEGGSAIQVTQTNNGTVFAPGPAGPGG